MLYFINFFTSFQTPTSLKYFSFSFPSFCIYHCHLSFLILSSNSTFSPFNHFSLCHLFTYFKTAIFLFLLSSSFQPLFSLNFFHLPFFLLPFLIMHLFIFTFSKTSNLVLFSQTNYTTHMSLCISIMLLPKPLGDGIPMSQE